MEYMEERNYITPQMYPTGEIFVGGIKEIIHGDNNFGPYHRVIIGVQNKQEDNLFASMNIPPKWG